MGSNPTVTATVEAPQSLVNTGIAGLSRCRRKRFDKILTRCAAACAAIALQLAGDPEFASRIDALVLESPVLDWGATIAANCTRAGFPSWFGALARPWLENPTLVRLAGLAAAVPLARFNWLERAGDVAVPALILHGIGDTSSPAEISVGLAALRPDAVCTEKFSADHTMTWNTDSDRWRSIVSHRLADLTRKSRDGPAAAG